MKDRAVETTRRHVKHLAAAAAVIALAVAFMLTGGGANAQNPLELNFEYINADPLTSPPQDGARTNFEVGVLLSAESQSAVTVDFHTRAHTATPGQDYIDVAATLRFPPGVTRRTVDIPILGDDIGEYIQRFEIHLSNPTGAQLGSEQRGAGDNKRQPQRHLQGMGGTAQQLRAGVRRRRSGQGQARRPVRA